MESPAAEGGSRLCKRLGSLFFAALLGQSLAQPHLEPQVLGIHVGHELENIYLLVLVVLLFVNLEKVLELGQCLGLEPLVLVEIGQFFVSGKEFRVQTKYGPVNSYCLGCKILLHIAGGNLFVASDRFLFPPGSGLNISKAQNEPLILRIHFHQLLEGLYRLVQVPLGQVLLGYCE